MADHCRTLKRENIGQKTREWVLPSAKIGVVWQWFFLVFFFSFFFFFIFF